MNKEEQYELILESPSKWDQYRADNPDFKPDLSGCDLSNTFFFNVNLSHANLEGCNFRGSTLTNTHFFNSSLRKADFEGADARSCNFDESDLTKSLCRHTRFNGAWFKNANLQDAEMMETSLANTDLTGANLTGANFSNSNGDANKILSLRFDTYTVVINTVDSYMWCDYVGLPIVTWYKHPLIDIPPAIANWFNNWKILILDIIEKKGVEWDG